jgi:hypothetical protein
MRLREYCRPDDLFILNWTAVMTCRKRSMVRYSWPMALQGKFCTSVSHGIDPSLGDEFSKFPSDFSCGC